MTPEGCTLVSCKPVMLVVADETSWHPWTPKSVPELGARLPTDTKPEQLPGTTARTADPAEQGQAS